MRDRKELIKALELCIKLKDKACPRRCPFYKECCLSDETHPFIPIMRAALEFLKEEPEIVRCKDCRHYGYNGMTNVDGYCYCLKRHEYPNPDWFCADGEERK